MTSYGHSKDLVGDDKIPDTLSASPHSHDDFGAQVSTPEASRQCAEAYQLFDGIYNQWNNSAVLPPGETFLFDLLTPDQHLVRNSFKLFNEYVKSRPGWSLKRREATAEERKMYRIRRKTKVYFVQAVYTVPLEGISGADSMNNGVQYYEEVSFARSSNSAFSPARPLGGARLFDSTNAAHPPNDAEKKPSKTSRVGENPAALPQPLDPNRSFVPLVRSPGRKRRGAATVKSSSPPLRRPLPLAAATSPLSPHMPPQMTALRISNPVLQAAPQQVFSGGFVYGDIVRIDNYNHLLPSSPQGTSGQRGIVVGQSPSAADRVVVSTNMERLEVAVQELTLLKGMPRWTSTVASPPLKDGRSYVPK